MLDQLRTRRVSARTDTSEIGKVDNRPEEPTGPTEPTSVDLALTYASELIDSGRDYEARRSLQDAVTELGASAPVLQRLAELESEDNEPKAALVHSEEAVALAPKDPEILGAHVRLLAEVGLERRAMEFVAQLSAELRDDPRVRAALGRIYATAGWYALATDTYGKPTTLPDEAQSERRVSWWRSGGPLSFVRRRIRRVDESAQAVWRRFSRSLSVLDSVENAAEFEVVQLRGLVDWYLAEWATVWNWGYIVDRCIRRYASKVLAVVSATAVFGAMRLFRSTTPVWIAAMSAIAVTAFGLTIWKMLRKLERFDVAAPRSLVAVTALSLSLIGVGAFLIQNSALPPSLQGDLAIAFVVGPVMGGCHAVAIGALGTYMYWYVKRRRRYTPRVAIIDILLDIILEIEQHDRNDLEVRGAWARQLELAAGLMERELPRLLRSGNAEIDANTADRARGAATALRSCIPEIVAPTEPSWRRLTCALRAETAALASGDLGSLRWVMPPEPSRPKQALSWRSMWSLLRTAVVTLAPITLLLAFQGFLKLDSHTYALAKISSLVWAFLYAVLTLDPALNEKIVTARNLIGTIREVKPQKHPADD